MRKEERRKRYEEKDFWKSIEFRTSISNGVRKCANECKTATISYLKNEVKVITDTVANKALKEGDSYKIQFSVSDEDIGDPKSAKISGDYSAFEVGTNRDGVLNATITHDEANKCYIITSEGNVTAQPLGIWIPRGVTFIYADGSEKLAYLDRNDTESNRHYVIDDTIADQLVLNYQYRDMNIGDSLQLTATLLPSLNAAEVEWFSENENIATVDNTGKVTTKDKGKAFIYARYKDNVYCTTIHVKGDEGKKQNRLIIWKTIR